MKSRPSVMPALYVCASLANANYPHAETPNSNDDRPGCPCALKIKCNHTSIKITRRTNQGVTAVVEMKSRRSQPEPVLATHSSVVANCVCRVSHLNPIPVCRTCQSPFLHHRDTTLWQFLDQSLRSNEDLPDSSNEASNG